MACNTSTTTPCLQRAAHLPDKMVSHLLAIAHIINMKLGLADFPGCQIWVWVGCFKFKRNLRDTDALQVFCFNGRLQPNLRLLRQTDFCAAAIAQTVSGSNKKSK